MLYFFHLKTTPTKNRKLTKKKTKTKYADNITNKKNIGRKLYLNILNRTPDQRAI